MKRDEDDWIEDEPAERRPRRPEGHRTHIFTALIGAVAVVMVPVIAYFLSQIGNAPQSRQSPQSLPSPQSQQSSPTVSSTINFIVLKPIDGARVGLKESISGRTPHVEANHYVVVTPVMTGQPYIQRQATVSDQGTWAGTAQFGEAGAGFGEKFMVYAIATKQELRPGPLTRSLDVLEESPHITVRRTKN